MEPQKQRHATFLIQYPRRRRKVLTGAIAKRLRELIWEAARAIEQISPALPHPRVAGGG